MNRPSIEPIFQRCIFRSFRQTTRSLTSMIRSLFQYCFPDNIHSPEETIECYTFAIYYSTDNTTTIPSKVIHAQLEFSSVDGFNTDHNQQFWDLNELVINPNDPTCTMLSLFKSQLQFVKQDSDYFLMYSKKYENGNAHILAHISSIVYDRRLNHIKIYVDEVFQSNRQILYSIKFYGNHKWTLRKYITYGQTLKPYTHVVNEVDTLTPIMSAHLHAFINSLVNNYEFIDVGDSTINMDPCPILLKTDNFQDI